MFKIGWTQVDINQFLTASLHRFREIQLFTPQNFSILFSLLIMGKGVANDWRKKLIHSIEP